MERNVMMIPSNISIAGGIFTGRFVKQKKTTADLIENCTSLIRVPLLKIENRNPHKKNVLIVVPHVGIGGAGKVLFDVVHNLRKDEYEFHLLSHKKKRKMLLKSELYDNYANTFFPTQIIVNSNVHRKYYYRIIGRLNIKLIIFTNSPVVYELLPELKKDFKDLKVIDLIHAEEGCGARGEYIKYSKYVDKRILISNQLKDHVINMYDRGNLDRKLKKRISVIYNGVDTTPPPRSVIKKAFEKDPLNRWNDSAIISFIGRLSWEKDPLYFVRIAKRLTTESKLKGKDVRFLLIGDGDQRKAITDEIKKQDMSDRFFLTGFVSDPRVYLMRSKILLITSKKEGIPLTALEAMSCGVPVISTDCGAIGELIVNGKNGYIVKKDKEQEDRFVEHISRLLTDERSHFQMSAHCKAQIMQNFSLKSVGKSYQQLIDGIIDA